MIMIFQDISQKVYKLNSNQDVSKSKVHISLMDIEINTENSAQLELMFGLVELEFRFY